jgi:hypothetical protein
MQCYKFRTRSGAVHILTTYQERALKEANVWDVIQYTFVERMSPVADVRPTQTDAQVYAEHMKDFAFPHVGLLHPQFRDDARPYFVRGPRRVDPDAAVPSWYDALKVARGMWSSKIVTVTNGDCQISYDVVDELGVILLVF